MWIPKCASAQGLAYFQEGRNNQDAIASYSDKENAIVFINDGCHAGKYSEIGARLSCSYLVRKTREMVIQNMALPLIAKSLFANYIDFLQWQTDCQFFDASSEISDFISNHLLCTTMGIICTPNEVMLLSAGDGSFYLNDKIFEIIRSPDNKPTYPAYNLYQRFGFEVGEELHKLSPQSFKTTILSASEVSLVGVASDGLNEFPGLIEELRNHSSSNLNLQLCLNRIAVIRAETIDNVTISFIQKKED